MDLIARFNSRYHGSKEKEWQSNDVEIQRLVIRSMSAFLDAIVPDKWQMPIVKVYKSYLLRISDCIEHIGYSHMFTRVLSQ